MFDKVAIFFFAFWHRLAIVLRSDLGIGSQGQGSRLGALLRYQQYQDATAEEEGEFDEEEGGYDG